MLLNDIKTLQKRFFSHRFPFPVNSWIYDDKIQIYMRFSFALDQNGKRITALQIANIQAENPGQGALSNLLPEIEKLAKTDIIQFENVHPEQLWSFLERNNYIIWSDYGIVRTYAKYLTDNQ